jgi:hypothetical protein
MSTFTKNDRFEVDNQTHYNTADLIEILDFMVDKESKGEETRWRRSPPQGALIQFLEFRGDNRYNRSTEFNHEKQEWEFTNKRVYVLPQESKMWHVVKIVPPQRIFENELEALSADMTAIPYEMYRQLVVRLTDMVPVDLTWSGAQSHFPDGFLPGKVRIEAEKQGKRRAAVRRPEQLFELREKERAAGSEVSSMAYRSRWTAGKIHDLGGARKMLGLSDVTPYADRLALLHEQLQALSDEFQALIDATPTA